ncbi:hypothetical protein Lalb_Chr01g0007121 [Lupinus albus]|uniref:Small auxin-up RNA n=1 Tax=Lupinus albus TaxID=3870 RepID=A0A6A4R5K6_LUPAL|nr:hypothetical protein Lalb_Chr01g0007121 [Lupinus albus]
MKHLIRKLSRVADSSRYTLLRSELHSTRRRVLRIPCHVIVFERVLEALRLGLDSRDLHDLISFSSEELC